MSNHAHQNVPERTSCIICESLREMLAETALQVEADKQAHGVAIYRGTYKSLRVFK